MANEKDTDIEFEVRGEVENKEFQRTLNLMLKTFREYTDDTNVSVDFKLHAKFGDRKHP